MRADVHCICLKLDFFLLNAEVQVQTCNCIPAKRILSQHSLSGQHRAGPPLKPSLSALELLTVFKGAKNRGRTGAKRSQTKQMTFLYQGMSRALSGRRTEKAAESAEGMWQSGLIIHLTETDLQQGL